MNKIITKWLSLILLMSIFPIKAQLTLDTEVLIDKNVIVESTLLGNATRDSSQTAITAPNAVPTPFNDAIRLTPLQANQLGAANSGLLIDISKDFTIIVELKYDQRNLSQGIAEGFSFNFFASPPNSLGAPGANIGAVIPNNEGIYLKTRTNQANEGTFRFRVDNASNIALFDRRNSTELLFNNAVATYIKATLVYTASTNSLRVSYNTINNSACISGCSQNISYLYPNATPGDVMFDKSKFGSRRYFSISSTTGSDRFTAHYLLSNTVNATTTEVQKGLISKTSGDVDTIAINDIDGDDIIYEGIIYNLRGSPSLGFTIPPSITRQGGSTELVNTDFLRDHDTYNVTYTLKNTDGIESAPQQLC